MAAVDGMASPHPARDPEDRFSEFHNDIHEMVQHQGLSNDEVVAALKRRGFETSKTSLKRRLQVWGIRREQGDTGVRTGVSDDLTEAINQIFHHTQLNDNQIAQRVFDDYKLHTTGRQVRTVRSLFGWRRRHWQSSQSNAEQTAATQAQVQAVLDGPGRTFGREWLVTYLRVHHGYKARRLDVSIAQRALDPAGVAFRTPGQRIPRLENYVTSGPNFLWCLDGHDKLAQYGIQIYAAVDAYSRKII
jgi:hypothetical protein